MDQSLDTAFVLTAGVGSRLRPHTERRPKPGLPFLSLPLCAYSFFLCKQAGFNRFIFNLHHLPEQMRKLALDFKDWDDEFYFSDESSEILGSGGAYWGAQEQLKSASAFLAANGDEIMIPSQTTLLKNLQKTFFAKNPLACLLVTDHPDLLKSLKPVWINNNNEVLGFGMDKPNDDCKPVHFTGYKIYSQQILRHIPPGNSNIFYDVLTERIAAGDKVIVHYEKNLPWFETGNFESYLQATRNCLNLIANGNIEYFQELFQFFGKEWNQWELLIKDKGQIFKPKILQIPEDLQWSGIVCLDEDVKIEESVKLKNCIAERGTKISAESTFEDCFILKE